MYAALLPESFLAESFLPESFLAASFLARQARRCNQRIVDGV
jgi:hypothetical protein